MALETGTTIASLVATNPTATDPRSEGDDHIRLLKAVLQADVVAVAHKDATGGVPGLTLFALNMKNALNTFTSYFTNANTASRTYTLPDASGTIALVADVKTVAQGGTGAVTAAAARTSLGAAASGGNTDITSLTALASINGGQIAGLRSRIINGRFGINQRGVSGTVTLTAGSYGHDRYKAGASGCTYTFAASANGNLLTISAGTLQQVIEGANLEGGSFILSWTGTATGRVDSGSYGASGVVGTAVAGTNQTVEFGTGTLGKVQYELGAVATTFEQRPIGMELALCQRYYETSYPTGVAPGTVSGTADGGVFYAVDVGSAIGGNPFKIKKRASPTIVIYSPTTGTAGTARNNNSGTGFSMSPTDISDAGFNRITGTITAAHQFSSHWTASAEL